MTLMSNFKEIKIINQINIITMTHKTNNILKRNITISSHIITMKINKMKIMIINNMSNTINREAISRAKNRVKRDPETHLLIVKSN